MAITGVDRIIAKGNAINFLKKLFFPPAIPNTEPKIKEITKDAIQRQRVVKKCTQKLCVNNNVLHKLKTDIGPGKINSESIIKDITNQTTKSAIIDII